MITASKWWPWPKKQPPLDGLFRQCLYSPYQWQLAIGGRYIRLLVDTRLGGWGWTCRPEVNHKQFRTPDGQMLVTEGDDEQEAIVKWYEAATGKKHQRRDVYLRELRDHYRKMGMIAWEYERTLEKAAECAQRFDTLRYQDRPFKIRWTLEVAAPNFRAAARQAFDILQGLGDRTDRAFEVTDLTTGVDQQVNLNAGQSMQLFSIRQFERFSEYLTWEDVIDASACTTQEEELICLLGYYGQLVHPLDFQNLAAKQLWSARDVFVDRLVRINGYDVNYVSRYFPNQAELIAALKQNLKRTESEHAFFDHQDQLHLIEGAVIKDLIG